jgi:hypothetical protein
MTKWAQERIKNRIVKSLGLKPDGLALALPLYSEKAENSVPMPPKNGTFPRETRIECKYL